MSTAIVRTVDGDLDALEADITLPRIGPWVAHVTLREPSAATGAASLVLTGADGAEQEFIGTIRRSGRWDGAAEVRLVLVPGAGTMASAIGPLDHAAATGVPVSLVVAGIVADAGEELAEGVADALAGLSVARWTRAEGTGIEALSLISDAAGLSWRALDDGTFWVGEETWPEVTTAEALGDQPMAEDHDDGRIEGRPSAATLRPGVVLLDRRIERVTFRVGGGAFTVEALYPVTGEAPRDLAPRVYRETHGARVVAQNADGTLELEASDPRLGSLSAVAFRCGIPGAKLTIPAGSRVRLGFEGGRPDGAFAFALDQDPTAAKGVVRVGDAGDGGTFSAVGVAPGAPIQFVYQSPFGGAPVTVPTVQIVTKATAGSSEVKIR